MLRHITLNMSLVHKVALFCNLSCLHNRFLMTPSNPRYEGLIFYFCFLFILLPPQFLASTQSISTIVDIIIIFHTWNKESDMNDTCCCQKLQFTCANCEGVREGNIDKYRCQLALQKCTRRDDTIDYLIRHTEYHFIIQVLFITHIIWYLQYL